LRGYFDGDGCIYLNKKNRVAAFIITSGSLSFLQSLKIEIEKIIDEKIPKVYKHKYGWFDIRSSKISVLHKIYDLMYPPNLNHLYLTRKKEKFQDVIEIL